MKVRDLKEIGVTALATALVVTGAFMVRPGISDGPLSQTPTFAPYATVGACKITVPSVKPTAGGPIVAVLHVANGASSAQNIQFNAVLVRTTFTGSLVSRVPSMADYKRAAIQTQKIALSVPSASERDLAVSFTLPASATKAAAQLGAQATYQLDIDNGHKDLTVGSAFAVPTPLTLSGPRVAMAQSR
jgi:hypothetical protein